MTNPADKNHTVELPVNPGNTLQITSNTTSPHTTGLIANLRNSAINTLELNPELYATLELVQKFISKYPQLNPKDGTLNYYISGSVATMLLILSQGKFDLLDPAALPSVSIKAQFDAIPEAINTLNQFARKVNDMDYVPLDHYKEKSEAHNLEISEQLRTNQITTDEYASLRAKYISKGNLPLQDQSIFVDPLNAHLPPGIARISIDGLPEAGIYICEPKQMLAYKIVHLLESFRIAHKTEKLVADFTVIYESFKQIYTADELLTTALKAVTTYMPDSADSLNIPFHNPEFNGPILEFINLMLQQDPDYPFIANLPLLKERSIIILKALHRISTQQGKQMVIDFISKHQDQINRWKININDDQNLVIFAQLILANPDSLTELSRITRTEITAENIRSNLERNRWVLYKFEHLLPDNSPVRKEPEKSSILAILMQLEEASLQTELPLISELIELEINLARILEIYRSDVLQVSFIRIKLIQNIIHAKKNLSKEDFNELLHKVCRIIAGNIPSENKIATVAQIFGDYNLKDI